MASRPKLLRRADGTLLVQRFAPIRRVEHVLGITVFVMLVLTGFPQRYHDAGWATSLLGFFGGLEQTREIHRIVGLVFAGHAVFHLGAIAIGTLTRRMRLSLLPTPRDLRDAWKMLRYYLGSSKAQPDLPKFDYRQKFEYIGLVLGGLVMLLTGLMLMYPHLVVAWLPGELIPAAQVAHSNEAMLALLVLVIWHAYGASLNPEVFPIDTCIFTGYLTADELKERHAEEYRRLFPAGHNDIETAAGPDDTEPADAQAETPPDG